LETNLGSLRSNFRTHKHLYHGDTDKIQYAVDHLGSWAYHTDRDMEKTTMIDPIPWGQDVQKNNSPCLNNLNIFVAEIQKLYGDNVQRLIVARKSFYDFPQGYENTNKNVRSYANRLRGDWREAEWDQVQFQPMLYDIVWPGLKADLLPKLKPFTKENGKFNSIDELLIEQLMLKLNRKSTTNGNSSHRASRLVPAGKSATSGHQSQKRRTYLRTHLNPTSPIGHLAAAENINLRHHG